MTPRLTLALVWLAFTLLVNVNTLAAEDPVTPGQLTGGAPTHFPSWFKESFLDISEDVNEASESGKHLILFMHLNGCPYCARMADENFSNAPYSQFIRDNFDAIAINIKGDREVAFNEQTTVTEKALARLLKVRYTPTILFLNRDNKTVLRLNGYRSVPAFKQALEYVQQQAYLKTSLNRFIAEQEQPPIYRFHPHPMLKSITDLQSAAHEPLAILFEDSQCDACDELHEGHLSNPKILKVLEQFTLVRLDANSTDTIIDPQGNTTTPRDFVDRLGLTYRPGIVLFDRGREIKRIDGLLYTYHFQEVLRYVGERHYETYPKNFYDYLNARTEQILKSGKSIDLSK